MLDPQARALIDLMVERGVPPTHTMAPDEARRMYRERRGYTQPPAPDLPGVRDLRCPGPAGDIGLRLYRPGPGPGDADGQPLPALVYLHGGGWTIGDLDTHDVLCRQLARDAHCVVLSVDYRLAPEHRFPAAFDDTIAAVRFASASAEALGVDRTRIAVGGDSAGGNLAAAACLALRDDRPGGSDPVLQLLIYPATDMRAVAPSHVENARGYLLTAESIAWYRGHYVPDPADWTDWRASPLLAADHRALPPAFVLTAGYDPLRDEAHQYADALSAAGVTCQVACFPRQIHGFVPMGRVIDEANLAVALCAAALRRAFAEAG